MDTSVLFELALYFVMFALSFYALSGLDFGRLFRPGNTKVLKVQLLLWLCALALGYLASKFLLAIMQR